MLLSKATYIAFKLHILLVLAFPGNRTHDLGVARIMLTCKLHRLHYQKQGQNFFSELGQSSAPHQSAIVLVHREKLQFRGQL